MYSFVVNYSLIAIREFFFSSRRRHTRFDCDWSSDVCSSDLCTRKRSRASARCCPCSKPWRKQANPCWWWLKRSRARHWPQDRKSTRLNSSHSQISYAVFCLKKKKQEHDTSV